LSVWTLWMKNAPFHHDGPLPQSISKICTWTQCEWDLFLVSDCHPSPRWRNFPSGAVEECFLFIFLISKFWIDVNQKNSKLGGIYTWKINSKIFPISLWKNDKVSLGTSTWSILNQTNSWVMHEDSCTSGKYHVDYTPETSFIKFLTHNSSTKTGLWQADGFLAFLKNSKAWFSVGKLMPWTARMRPSMAMKGSRGTKPMLNTGSFPPRKTGSPVGSAVAALVGGKWLYHGLF